MPRLFHIITAEQWRRAQELYQLSPPSLQSEGFVHFSYEHQVAGVANNLYADVDDLIVVEFDPTQVGSAVVDEDSYGTGQEFPHVYAEIPVAAAVAEHGLSRAADGRYRFEVPTT
jgi:uncharacterized protein (DUF952 family)